MCASVSPLKSAAMSLIVSCVVLMDLQMPTMDGFETARRIRELPGYERVPVIALTARVGGEARLACLDRGMQGFLEKPLDAGKLAAAIERVLG